MAAKRDLSKQLGQVVQGQPYRLSTTSVEEKVEAEEEEVQPIQRDNAKIRRDLIKEFKMLAVKQDRKLYEVMEEALAEYLTRDKDTNG
ncbi:MAG: hypothetical protein HXX20_19935 [Chloroflexi bacterium]|nr:hypothetical protein [Chloroflexota bacterium]